MREYVVRKSISNLTIVNNDLYFGAGPNIYKLNTLTRSLETVHETDRTSAEQPIVVDGIIYFGALRAYSVNGWRGETPGLFAYDLASQRLLWKFPLDKGYGTFGTYPNVVGDRILVCGREHLYSLDRKTGTVQWKVDNWLGSTGDTVNIPYVDNGHAYFKVSEEHVAGSQKTDENDGHWAEVDIENGRRTIFPIAEHPGTYEYSSGQGINTLVDGVIYGNNRVDRFAALDLRSKKLLWEIETDTLIQPVVKDGRVFLIRHEQIQAVDHRTGQIIWTTPLSGISVQLTYNLPRFEEYHARRIVSADDSLVVQGSLAVALLDLKTGTERWRFLMPSKTIYTTPAILGSRVFVASEDDCSIVELDLRTGAENGRVAIPECTYYVPTS